MDMAIIENSDVQDLREKCTTVKNQGMCMKLLDDIFDLFKMLITIIATFTILASFDAWIFIALVFFSIIYFLLTIYNKNLNHKAWELGTQENRRANYYSETMNNTVYAKEIRLFSLSVWLVRKFEESKLELIQIMKKFTRTFTLLILSTNSLKTLQEVFLYVYFGARVIYNGMTFGNFTMMIAAVNRFIQNIEGLSNTIIQLFDRVNYINYYIEYLNYPNVIAVEDKESLPIPKSSSHEIEFVNVFFAYQKANQNVFENFNIKLEHSKFYVMVGVNGAGKTTFLNLLCRLYDPQKGKVLLDGKDIKSYDYKEYRDLFSVVFQDYRYYAFTIAENIALNSYDRSDVVRSRINECIEKSGLKIKIESFEKGIDTKLRKIFDNNGVDLSGGETQKLALARALFKGSPFLLLDEPSSALDAFAENDLISRFKEASKGKTIIYVSHRLSVAKYADKVIFINGGVIEGFDTHEELFSNNTAYNKLYMAQAKHYLDGSSQSLPKKS
jgi:ABC-type multidrug transport system fused ATPase/permease subunit